MRYRWAALLLLATPLPTLAQEQRAIPDLPRDVERRVESMRGDASARRLSGPVTIPAGDAIATDVVVDGTLTLAGRIDGDLLVLGGDLLFVEGAAVTGDVLVVGGAISGAERATVGGTLLSYGPARPYARADERDANRDDAWEKDDRERDGRWRHPRHDDDEGGIDLSVSIAGNYNRVEGLPVMFGPVIRTAGPNRLTISGQAIWRTEPSESLDDEIGYRARVQQELFGGALRVGGEASSLVRPIETRGLNSTEAGLAAALFHSDLHDYYAEESWAAQIELRPTAFPLDAWLVYRVSEQGALEESDPWSLLNGDDAWRPQPIVARGDIATLLIGMKLDTRDDEDEPMRGFLGSVVVEHALDQDLGLPAFDVDGAVAGGQAFDDVTIASADLRAYLPVNRSSTLNLRGFVGGSVEETVLPPQFQRAIGGIGTLPGFSLFEGACGSRATRARLVRGVDDAGLNELSDEPMLAAYGCDRVALGQLEYRGGFDVHEYEDERHHWHDVDVSADWSFFVNVARGWAYGDMPFVDRSDTETMADVGFGVLFDQLGVYVGLPVTGEDRSLRAAVRLQRRF